MDKVMADLVALAVCFVGHVGREWRGVAASEITAGVSGDRVRSAVILFPAIEAYFD